MCNRRYTQPPHPRRIDLHACVSVCVLLVGCVCSLSRPIVSWRVVHVGSPACRPVSRCVGHGMAETAAECVAAVALDGEVAALDVSEEQTKHHDHHHNFASLKILTPNNRPLVVCEKGRFSFFTLELTSRPRHPVIIDLEYDNDLAICHPNTLCFDHNNWETPQKISVKSVVKPASDGTEDTLLKFRSQSKDHQYNGTNLVCSPPFVVVHLIDCDAPFLWQFGTVGSGHDITVDLVPQFLDLALAENIPRKTNDLNRNGREAWVRPWRDHEGVKFKRPKPKCNRKNDVKAKLLSHINESTKLKGKSYLQSKPHEVLESRRHIHEKKWTTVFDESPMGKERQALEEKQKEQEHLDILKLWQNIDVDASGSVSLETLRNHMKNALKVSEAYIARMISFMDTDNSGTIVFKEFRSYMNNRKRIYAAHQAKQELKRVEQFEADELMLEKRLFPHSSLVETMHATIKKKRHEKKRRKKKRQNSLHMNNIVAKVQLAERRAQKKRAPSHITDISCGQGFSTFVAGDGRLYTWGSNGLGQLGHGDSTHRPKPTVWDGLDILGKKHRILTVSCGDAHVACLTFKGHVLTWGCGANGRLGHGNTRDANVPIMVKFGRDTSTKTGPIMESVVCGGRYTMALNLDRDVYSWGFGQTGVLAHCDRSRREDRRADILFPTKVHFFGTKHPKRVVCGGGHAIFIMGGHGKALSVGWGGDGQLGRAVDGSDDVPRAIEMPAGEAVCAAACGESHSLVLCENDHVYSFGLNTSGQLGLGHRYNKNLPTRVPFLSHPHVCMLRAGARHSGAVTTDGFVYMWGAGETGGLGFGGNKDKVGVDMLTPRICESFGGVRVAQLGLGHAHSVATTMEVEPENQIQESIIVTKVFDRIRRERAERVNRLFQAVDQVLLLARVEPVTKSIVDALEERLKSELVGWKDHIICTELNETSHDLQEQVREKLRQLMREDFFEKSTHVSGERPCQQNTIQTDRLKKVGRRPHSAAAAWRRNMFIPTSSSQADPKSKRPPRPSTACTSRAPPPPKENRVPRQVLPPSRPKTARGRRLALHSPKVKPSSRPKTARGCSRIHTGITRPASAAAGKPSPRIMQRERPSTSRGRVLYMRHNTRAGKTVLGSSKCARDKMHLVEKYYGVKIEVEKSPKTSAMERQKLKKDMLRQSYGM